MPTELGKDCALTFFYELLHDANEPRTIGNMNSVPEKIIRNGPATIVFWKDGTKTIVKHDGTGDDSTYTAFCAAVAKKIFRTNTQIKKVIKTTLCDQNKGDKDECQQGNN